MSRTERLWARLRSGEILVADGATGTMLQNEGLEPGRVPEAWVLERPDAIRSLHESYIRASADIILTCTFGANRYRLESDGLADQVVEINRLAAEIARAAADENVFVAGDMGPTGQLLRPFGPLSPDEMRDAYAEQARGLAEGGADFLLIETMSDLGEAQAAIAGARSTATLPIVCTFSFDTHGRTMMGYQPEIVAKKIGPLVDGVGANCGREPDEYIGFIHAMRQVAPEAIIWVKPNAGLPHLVDDEVVYDATPAKLEQVAVELVEAGAQIVGGCCGTTPQHVAAIATRLKREHTEES
jgi:5-methyltetrahydrofolate--homocysteine methyltransferase